MGFKVYVGRKGGGENITGRKTLENAQLFAPMCPLQCNLEPSGVVRGQQLKKSPHPLFPPQ